LEVPITGYASVIDDDSSQNPPGGNNNRIIAADFPFRSNLPRDRPQKSFKISVTSGVDEGLSIIEQDPSKLCQRSDI